MSRDYQILQNIVCRSLPPTIAALVILAMPSPVTAGISISTCDLGTSTPLVRHASSSHNTQLLREGALRTAAFHLTFDSGPISASDPAKLDARDAQEAKVALEYAFCDLLAYVIESPVQIRVRAAFEDLTQVGIHVTAVNETAFRWPSNPPAGVATDRIYTTPLLEKLTGTNVNSNGDDIPIRFNTTSRWHFDIEGGPPSKKLDFVTHVLHEAIHGLGFSGTMTIDSTLCGGTQKGCWGIPGALHPSFYDSFAEDSNGDNVVAIIPNRSHSLYNHLRNGDLFLNDGGGLVKASNGNTPPRVQRSNTWVSGASFIHLMEADYGQGDPNSLMTPATLAGEALHNPGPIALAVLHSMGWGLTENLMPLLSDVKSTDPHWSYIYYLAWKNVIDGYSDGTFKPNRHVNRAEILKMVYLGAAKDPGGGPATPCFVDVATTEWFHSFVCDAKSKGYVQGFDCPGGKCFRPAANITRAEAVKMVAAVFEIDPATDANSSGISFPDVQDVQHWSDEFVNWIANSKIASGPQPFGIPIQESLFRGRSNGLFEPDVHIRRGEMAKLIANVMIYINSGSIPDGSLSFGSLKTTSTSSVGAAFESVVEAGNRYSPDLTALNLMDDVIVVDSIEFEGPIQDEDEDDVYYLWSVSGGSLSLVEPVQASRVVWTPPSVSGETPFKIYVLASDGRGKVKRKILHATVMPSGSIPPSIEVLTPNSPGTPMGSSFEIAWEDHDGSTALIDLYYDDTPFGFNGVRIAENLPAADFDQYSWDTSNVDGGEYYVYAAIKEAGYPAVRDYASGSVVVSQPPSSGVAHVAALTDVAAATRLNGARAVSVSDGVAYVVSRWDQAVQVVDVSDPTLPSPRGSIEDGEGGARLGDPFSIFVSGGKAYVTSFDNTGTLEILDISDPAAPSHIGSLVEGQNGALLEGASSVYVDGDYAYVTAVDAHALQVVDVSDPSQPIPVGSLIDGEGGALLATPRAISASNGYAYIAAGADNALEIVDISNPTNPQHVTALLDGQGGAIFDNPTSVFLFGNYAYVGGDNKIEIVDVSDPVSPIHVGFLAFAYEVTDLYVAYGHVFSVSESADRLDVIDIADPTQPAIVASLVHGGEAELDGASSIFVSGDYAYISANVSDALEIIDVSAFNRNTVPVLALREPDGFGGDAADESFRIQWMDDDDDNASITFYYDDNDQGEDGELIVDGIFEDDSQDEFFWQTGSVPEGEYYVYGVIDDGVNVPVVVYSSGTVEVSHPNAGPEIVILEPSGSSIVDTSFTITWTDDDPDNDAEIRFYYDLDDTGADGTLINVVAIDESDGTDRYEWDTTDVPAGEYYVYGVIDDGVNAPVLSYSAGTVGIEHCRPPETGNWSLTKSCLFIGRYVAPADILVEPGVVVTIAPGAVLEIDLTAHKVLVRHPGGVLVKQGGTLRQTTGTIFP